MGHTRFGGPNYKGSRILYYSLIVKTPTCCIKLHALFVWMLVFREGPVGGTINNERQTLHVSDDTRRVLMMETKTISGTTSIGPQFSPVLRYQHGDHLRSSCLETDDTAQLISFEEVWPFGTSSFRLENSSISVSTKRYRYSGKERDEETGMYYYGARYYAAWLGRWTACDPVIQPGQSSYTFCSCDPVGKVDPKGKQSEAGGRTDVQDLFQNLNDRLYLTKEEIEVFENTYTAMTTPASYSFEEQRTQSTDPLVSPVQYSSKDPEDLTDMQIATKLTTVVLKNDDVIVAVPLMRAVNTIADDAYFALERETPFVVTSGTRTSVQQAMEMYDNIINEIADGHDETFVEKYSWRKRDLAQPLDDIWAAGMREGFNRGEMIDRISAELQAQVDRGEYLSGHLEEGAVDFRARADGDQPIMTRAESDAFEQLIEPAIERVSREYFGEQRDHLHIRVYTGEEMSQLETTEMLKAINHAMQQNFEPGFSW